MKPPNKTHRAAAPRSPSQRPPQARSAVVVQKKEPHARPAAFVNNRQPPQAPPVYRPQPVPKVLQRKTAAPAPCAEPPNAARKTPAAPPVYRPQTTPIVLQRKPSLPATGANAAPQNPQPKSYAPPRQVATQTPRAFAPTHTRPAAARPSGVVQRMEVLDIGYNLPFGGGGGDDDDPKKFVPFHKSHYETKDNPKKRKRKDKPKETSLTRGTDTSNIIEGRRGRKSTQRKSAQFTLKGHKNFSESRSSMNTRNKSKYEKVKQEYEEEGILPDIRPNPPEVDMKGRTIWDGERNSIHWYTGFMAAWWHANGPKNHTSCIRYGNGACGGDMEIDHKQPAVFYILNGAGVQPKEVCDGSHHWNAYILDTPTTISSTYPLNPSGGDTIRTAYHHSNNLQAICQHHNGSKGSHRRGIDDPRPPELIGPCPEDCATHNGQKKKKLRKKKENK